MYVCVCAHARVLCDYISMSIVVGLLVCAINETCHICFILMLSTALNSYEMQSLPSAGYCPTGFLFQEMIQRFRPQVLVTDVPIITLHRLAALQTSYTIHIPFYVSVCQ